MPDAMIERMARASFKVSGSSIFDPNRDAPTWLTTSPYDRDHHRLVARAVLTAMREPTPEVLHVIGMCSTVGDWQEMIDAALAEEAA